MDAPSDTYGSDRSTSPIPPIQPLKNPKYRHISRSAAKRESVQLLGSIKDLQLHFSRAGLVEHRPGAGVGVKGLGSLDEGDEENRPPSALGPGGDWEKEKRERRPWKEVELPRVDPIQARREVRGLVTTVRNLWGLGMPASPSMVYFNNNTPTSPTRTTTRVRDTATTLVTTAQTLRRVRTLAFSISHTSSRRSSGSALVVPKSKARVSISTPSRPSGGGLPRAVSYNHTERKSSLGPLDETREDMSGELRKAALEILTGLRTLEERLRVTDQSSSDTAQPPDSTQSAHTVPPSSAAGIDVPQRTLSPGGGSTASSSMLDAESTRPTSMTFSEPETYNSEDEGYSFNAFAQDQHTEPIQTWEERIVNERREYGNMEAEEARVETVREGVRRWVGVVERLFGVREGFGVGELEEWARDEWDGRALERLHSFLLAHLPLSLALLLPSTASADFPQIFLSRLSDGFILTQAFNTAVLCSPKAWGFIPDEDIHDTLRISNPGLGSDGTITPEGEEIKTEREWTFRRVGNLTCWAAAVRLRYNLPVYMPSNSHSNFLSVPRALPPRSSSSSSTSSPSTSPTPESTPLVVIQPTPPAHVQPTSNVSNVPITPSVPSVPSPAPKRTKENAPKIEFDPLVVAKKTDGWEEMLGGLLDKWVDEAASEAREAVGGDGGEAIEE